MCSQYRAEFRVWREGEEIYYIMFEKVQPGAPPTAKHQERLSAAKPIEDQL